MLDRDAADEIISWFTQLETTDMGCITGGVVSVEDGVKAADFHPSRVVKVIINFDVPEDGSINGQGALDRAANMAHQKVRQLLHQAPEVIASRAEEALAKADAGIPTGAAGVKLPVDEIDARIAEGTARRTRRTRAQIDADEAAAKASSSSAASMVDDPPTPAADAASVVEPAAETPASSASSSTADVLDWNSVEVAATVTDAELNSACQTAAQGGVKPDEIKKLIGSYKTKDPWFLASIPNEQRQDFLTKLGALK